jgi:hypothetical protein
MIIKRWNGSAFVKEFPETKAQLIRNNGDTAFIFDGSDKLLPAYLPDSVFDNLKFQVALSAAASNAAIADALLASRDDAITSGNVQAVKGMYFVISTTGTISGLTAINGEVDYNTTYATLQFRPQDGGSSGTANTSSGVLEVGDWFVIESVTGSGTIGTPYVFTASVINNSYELATTAIDGVVRLSSRTTYAGLTGNNVVTEGVLKTVIDDASYAASGHVHGNVLNNGTITTNTAPASGQHLVITSSADAIQQSAITFGTGTDTYLRNDGTWVTPPDNDTTYSAATGFNLGLVKLFSGATQTVAANATSSTADRTYGLQFNATNQAVINVPWTDTLSTATTGGGLSVTSNAFQMIHPLYVQADAPSTPLTGTIWFDL